MGKRVGVLAALTGAILFGCATAEVRETRVVRGRIVDDAGRPVPDTPVTVVGQTLSFDATRMTYRVEARRDLVARTDQQGQYRIEFTPADLGNNLYLFFYGAEGFDAVRYRKNDGLNITDQLKTRRELRFDQALRPNPNWPEVQRLVAEYGADSPRGQILRTHGLPEKREPFTLQGQAGETWWYYSLGVSYRFVGPALQGRFAFEPAIPK
jgi:hypothetical protein